MSMLVEIVILKISILVEIYEKLSILVEIFHKSRFCSKFWKNIDSRQNFLKIPILVEISDKSPICSKFSKIYILVEIFEN